MSMISSHCPDLVILDLGLPDIDGMEILSRLRKWSGMPVVVISARSHEKDKVEALDERNIQVNRAALSVTVPSAILSFRNLNSFSSGT